MIAENAMAIFSPSAPLRDFVSHYWSSPDNLDSTYAALPDGAVDLIDAKVWIAVEVDDVDAEHERVRALGVAVEVALRDEPWGDRHFVVVDPNGIGVDVVQRRQPE